MNDRQLADLALAAAHLGSQAIQRELAGVGVTVETKQRPDDFVTSADKAAERAILDAVLAVRPKDAVLAEESGIQAGTSGVRWLVDPLDGTTNFVHGRRDYAVSVGVERDQQLVAGAVVRPADGDWAFVGDGQIAGRTGVPAVSTTTQLQDALVGIGMPAGREAKQQVHGFVGELIGQVRDYRRTGSSACELLELAYGRQDGYLGFGVHLWDIAGGAPLVTAAGGVWQWVTTASGLELIAAGNPTVCAQLVDLVKEI